MIAVIRKARVQNGRVEFAVIACLASHSFNLFRPRQIRRNGLDLNTVGPLQFGAQLIESVCAAGDGHDVGSVLTSEHDGHLSS
jgi:hypothetical protein